MHNTNLSIEPGSRYSIYSDDGEEPQLIIAGIIKREVFETLQDYDAERVRIQEWDEDEEEMLNSSSGDQWLLDNECPTCGLRQT